MSPKKSCLVKQNKTTITPTAQEIKKRKKEKRKRKRQLPMKAQKKEKKKKKRKEFDELHMGIFVH